MQRKQTAVRALERGLDILECLQRSPGPLSLSELADRVSLSPSTALRILATLENRHFIKRDAQTKFYSLGRGAHMMQSVKSAYDVLLPMSSMPMQELNRTFDESVSLYVPHGDKRVCIKRIESSHPLRPVVNVGDFLSLSIGAGGKVLTAWLTAQSDINPAKLLPPLGEEALRQIRADGYATSFGEREPGTYALAAPVFDAQGMIAAALSMSGPIVRFQPEMLAPMLEAMTAQAKSISVALGACRTPPQLVLCS